MFHMLGFNTQVTRTTKATKRRVAPINVLVGAERKGVSKDGLFAILSPLRRKAAPAIEAMIATPIKTALGDNSNMGAQNLSEI